MQHPILNSRSVFWIYLAIWAGLTITQIAGMHFFLHFSLSFASIVSIVYNETFALFSFGLWYTIRYLGIESQSPWFLLINHLLVAKIIIFIWLWLASTILEVLPLPDTHELEIVQRVSPLRFGQGFMYYLATVLFFYLHVYYTSFKQKQLSEAKLTSLLREAELNTLRSQLNPHFLFNSLNSVSSLTMIDGSKAQDMIIKLSSYLRYTIQPNRADIVTLEEELKHCMLYLDIEKIRFQNRLTVVSDIEKGSISARLPFMLLQPLFENAIKYGVQESSDEIKINFESKLKDNYLYMKMENAFDSSTVQSAKRNGSGLKNCKERLRLIYHNKATIAQHVNANIFTVEIQIPIQS